MDLSIVITTRNRKTDLLNCVKSIANSSYKKFEMIIIDDNSNDGTEKINNSDFKNIDVKIFHSKKQLMMVASRNLGANLSKGKFVLFVDDDNIFTKDAIKNIVMCAEKYSQYGVIGTPLYYYSTKKKNESAEKINFFTGGMIKVLEYKKDIVDTDSTPNVFLIKKEVLVKLGNFDKSLIQTYTEADFVLRSRKAGYKTGTCQKCIIYHNIKESGSVLKRGIGSVFPQKAYCLIRNRMVIVKRYGNFFQKIIFLLIFSWFWPIVYSIIAIKFKKTNLIKLYFYGYKDGLTYFIFGKLNNSLFKLKGSL